MSATIFSLFKPALRGTGSGPLVLALFILVAVLSALPKPALPEDPAIALRSPANEIVARGSYMTSYMDSNKAVSWARLEYQAPDDDAKMR